MNTGMTSQQGFKYMQAWYYLLTTHPGPDCITHHVEKKYRMVKTDKAGEICSFTLKLSKPEAAPLTKFFTASLISSSLITQLRISLEIRPKSCGPK